MTPRECVDALMYARAIIADKRRWCQDRAFHNKDDRPVTSAHKADCFCAMGALWAVTHEDEPEVYLRQAATPWSPIRVNDTLGRAAALKMYDRAIELAKRDARTMTYDRWWETAQPGDDFQDERGEWFRVVNVVNEGGGLCAVELDGIDEGYGVTSFPEAQLAKCAPDHVGNIRRHVAAVLRSGQSVGSVHHVPGRRSSRWVRHDASGWPVARFDTPEQAAEAIVPPVRGES